MRRVPVLAALFGIASAAAAPNASFAQGSPTDAPTAPIVPPTETIAALPMPARAAELDVLLAKGDDAAIRDAFKAARTGDELNRNMDWAELKIVQGGGVFLDFYYLDALWSVAPRLPAGQVDRVKRFAGVIYLYPLQVAFIDGARCADLSAAGHRVDQLVIGRAPIGQYVMSLPELTRRDLAVEAIKLEKRTANLRRDDPVLCGGGASDLSRAVEGKTPLSAAGVGDAALFVDPKVWEPKAAHERAGVPAALAKLLKLPEAQGH